MSADDYAVYTNLRGTVCACGKRKGVGKSFCRKDYFKLPKADRGAIYIRDGYPDIFRRCLRLLELPEPHVEPPQRDEPKSVERLHRNLRRALQ